jgi:hypothetical protein
MLCSVFKKENISRSLDSYETILKAAHSVKILAGKILVLGFHNELLYH